MGVTESEKIWHNGKLVAWGDARIHVLSHVVSYGSALFEGLRCYATPQGPALFRLGEHMQRLLNSAKIYRMAVGYDRAQLEQACIELIQANRLPQAYLRPIVLRGYGSMGVGVKPGENPIEVYIAAWDWGQYLGGQAQTEGVDVCVSSWQRIAPNTLPAMAKAAANYMNSQLIKQEAYADGYAEGIALDVHGQISEGSGENLFLLRQGKLFTSPLSSSVLPGITRDCVARIAAEMGIDVVEQALPRESLYLADEAFFCGTAVEITPIRSVDRIPVGTAGRGPVTEAIQKRFFALAKGEAPDLYGWRTPVAELVAAKR
ncbi:MAG TPA: branched-chain amino acid transaminase [Terriglobales bacterium]|nr:branched-chain amino acid transaminase [Terriglobales bacterium]